MLRASKRAQAMPVLLSCSCFPDGLFQNLLRGNCHAGDSTACCFFREEADAAVSAFVEVHLEQFGNAQCVGEKSGVGGITAYYGRSLIVYETVYQALAERFIYFRRYYLRKGIAVGNGIERSVLCAEFVVYVFFEVFVEIFSRNVLDYAWSQNEAQARVFHLVGFGKRQVAYFLIHEIVYL